MSREDSDEPMEAMAETKRFKVCGWTSNSWFSKGIFLFSSTSLITKHWKKSTSLQTFSKHTLITKLEWVTRLLLQLKISSPKLQDNDSHFHEALDHWRQLNLAPSFIQFAKKADGLSASMPLLLHNWREVYELWLEAFQSADDEGLRALLEWVPTLRSHFTCMNIPLACSRKWPMIYGRLFLRSTLHSYNSCSPYFRARYQHWL